MDKIETSKLLGMLAAGAASCILFSGTIAAQAAVTEYYRANDYILHDSYGNPYCSVNNQVQTGKFTLQPNYTLGDVDGNGIVNAIDASSILKAASEAGAGNATAAAILSSQNADNVNEEDILLFADVDNNAKVNATDASQILSYAAENGAGLNNQPMGFAYYYADENGILQSGMIHDEQTGETYYANEDYQLITGWTTINQKKYYFDETAAMHPQGWLEFAGTTYYIQEDGSVAADTVLLIENNWCQFDAAGKLEKSWASREASTEPETTIPAGWLEESGKKYYITETGEKATGWLNLDGAIYYLDDVSGEALSGWQSLTSSPEAENYYDYYFSPEDFTMQTGWLTLPEGKYYLDEDGSRHIGTLEYEGNTYKFDENGLLITNQTTAEGTYDENGVFTKKTKTEYTIPSNVASQELIDIINNADRTPGIRHIDVKNRQQGLPYTTDPDLKRGINLSDRDYEIIEAFAAEHFTEDMTIAECLYETWWWIHCNVQYAYVQGGYWASIEDKSYPDAIFNYQTGQCVQYNGAMAAMLAYFGYDVYMVKGWVNRESQSGQHYWTEVMIDGTRYYVETGNRGKNGDYWQYFFVNAEDVDYTATY